MEMLLREIGIVGVAALGAFGLIPLLAIALRRTRLSRGGYWLRLTGAALVAVLAGGAALLSLRAVSDRGVGSVDALLSDAPDLLIAPAIAAVSAIAICVLLFSWGAGRFLDMGWSRWWAAAPLLAAAVIAPIRIAAPDLFFDVYIQLIISGVPPNLVALWGVLAFGVWTAAIGLPKRGEERARR